MSKRKESPKIKFKESAIAGGVARYTNTILMTLATPFVLLGLVYLVAFFVLNSSFGPRIVSAQLTQFLRGEYDIATTSTDAFLQTLTMTEVKLRETGKKSHVVYAPRLEAKIPIVELFELSNNTLLIGRIKAYNADVYLDFTQGELNILKVVLPYFGKPEPPDPTPSDFSVFLSNLNVEHTDVHLVFDGFRIDLYDTDVDQYSIRTAPKLVMDSPRAKTQGKPGVRVSHGQLDFNPTTFSFAMASTGDADQGLIFDGGSDSAGKLGYAWQQSARVIGEIAREIPELSEKLGIAPDFRGHYLIPLKNTWVDGFHWDDQTFVIPEMETDVGEKGHIHMTEGMMNVGPTQQDIDDAAQKYHHTPSGLMPEESILWAAKLDMTLGVEDPLLSYFFGPVLVGNSKLRLMANMAGDLARVSGSLSLDIMDFETFDVEVDRLSLRAQMDGQHLEIQGLEADTMLGGVIATGYYEIMDGDFDIDLYAGKAPEAGKYTYIDPTFADRMKEGMTPMDMLPDGSIKRFNGLMSGHINAKTNQGAILVGLPSPMVYKLDEPFAGIHEVVLKPDIPGESILTYKDDIIQSEGGLRIDLGKSDYLNVEPGLYYNFHNLGQLNASVRAHIEDPAVYARVFDIEDLSTGPLDAEFAYHKCGKESCGKLKLNTGDISYMGVDIPKVELALNLEKSRLTSEKFLIQSEFATISASLQADNITPYSLEKPTSLPFHADIQIQDVDLENVHLEAVESLGLKGKGEGTLRMDGPIDKLNASLLYTMTDVEVMDVPIPRMRTWIRYEDNQVYLPMLNVWFKPAELDPKTAEKLEAEYQAKVAAAPNEEAAMNIRREYVRERTGDAYRNPDFAINTLTYDPATNFLSFNTVLQPTDPNDFKVFRDLDLPLEGKLSFDLSGNADLDLIAASFDSSRLKTMQPTWLEGDINVQDLKFAEMNLGNTDIHLSRSKQFSLIKGNIFDLFDLTGFVRTAPKFSVSASLNFSNLDVLQTMDQLNIDISSIASSLNISHANVAGSIGFCMSSLKDMTVSAVIDDITASVFDHTLSLAQPAFFRADLAKQSLNVRQLEFKYRDSVLKLSGTGDAKGNIDVDVNGEIDAAIARSFVSSVQESSGLLGISMSARGNLYHQDQISLRNMDISGYLGVRDPIQILTSLTDSPIELQKGFIVIGKNLSKCPNKGFCLYTPEDQPFKLGLNNEWVQLSMMATSRGQVKAALDGTINAVMAQLFVKDVSAASGRIDLHAKVDGDILDKTGLNIDLNQLKFEAGVAVSEPVSVELRSMNEPITIDDGMLQVASGNECPSKTECIVIPKSRPFKGNLMGGNYLIFGEVVREGITPKSGDLSITANNVSFRMKDELSLTVSPDIQIVARDLADFDTVTVSGNVDIGEARYKKNFDDGSSNFVRDQIVNLFIDSRRRVEAYSPSFLRKMPQVGKIHLDVGATAENSISADVKIAGASLNLEVGTQLRIGGTIKDFYPTGIVSISNGVFTLRDNDFEFQNGAQVAFNGSLDGKIDITATTEISTDSDAFSAVTGNTELDRRKRISTSSANSSDLYSITLTVGGSVFRPVWSFESSPYLTDTNVYALILTGRTIEDFSGNDIAMESLLSPFFSSQIDTFLNADQFKFVFREGAAQFVYVKQINKGLRIAAGVSIRGSDGNEQALSAEYYFNDNLFVDLTGQNTSDEEGRAPTFKLGARLHWHVLIE